jgi:hypothetical protein
MKKYIYLVTILFLSLIIASCDNNTTEPTVPDNTGKIFINSTPAGAQIFVDGTNTTKVTPDSTDKLSTGNHDVTLKLDGYRDTTITVNVVQGLTTTKFVQLTSTLSVTPYGPVTIYETLGTTVDQPSGLDLSTGNAYGVSGADKGKVDIYYTSSGYLVQSASLNTTQGLTRETFFLVGSGTNLSDGVSSPTYPIGGTWTNNINDTQTNYVFLYDDDSHYSKLRITKRGGGSGPGDPAWIEVTWIYNNTAIDTRF